MGILDTASPFRQGHHQSKAVVMSTAESTAITPKEVRFNYHKNIAHFSSHAKFLPIMDTLKGKNTTSPSYTQLHNNKKSVLGENNQGPINYRNSAKWVEYFPRKNPTSKENSKKITYKSTLKKQLETEFQPYWRRVLS